MNFEVNINALINDIMADKASTVMLFAPSGTGKTDFLTELSCRYRTVYWFNTLMDDMRLFTYTFIQKVLGGNPENNTFKDKLHQLLYCNSEFNDEKVAISAVLNHISNIKGDCIMIFERLEHLPDEFNMALLERIIHYSPSNLKIVLSSDDFLDINYMNFGTKHPKLIDESILGSRKRKTDYTEYLSDIPEAEIGFLAYISDLVAVRKEFVANLNPDAIRVLDYLSRKEYYVTTRDDRYFRLHTALREYLLSEKDKYAEYIAKYNDINVIDRYAEFEVEHNNLYSALSLYKKTHNLKGLNTTLNLLFHDAERGLLRLRSCLETRDDDVFQDDLQYPYVALVTALVNEIHGRFEKAAESLMTLIDVFRAMGDFTTETIAVAILARVANLTHADQNKYVDKIKEMFEIHKNGDKNCIYSIYCATLPHRKVLGISVAKYDSVINDESRDAPIVYMRGQEELALAYFDMGNYRRAQEIADKLKAYFPWYVIPHMFIPFYYYQGEIDRAEKMATDALAFAEQNGITKDVGLLHCTLGMVDLFKGNVEGGLKKLDESIRCKNDSTFVKFHCIAHRCMGYAKCGKVEYSKDLAHFNLKYCEAKNIEYVNMMQIALSYAHLKLGNKEKAYQFATKCVQNSKSRSTNWLLGMAIATSYMLEKGDLKDGITLVRNLLRSAESFGMEVLLVDHYTDIFDTIIAYARTNEIEKVFVDKITNIAQNKLESRPVMDKLKINMFGDVQITVGGKDVLWKTRKSKDLFLLYILAGNVGIDRNMIIDAFWKDYVYESAINNLKTTNNIIRKTLKASGVDFVLEYVNSRYILRLNGADNDYVQFRALMSQYANTDNVAEQVIIMQDMVKLYKSDFATDIAYQEFIDERKNLKQEITIKLLKLARALANKGEYIEAKSFLATLSILDKHNDYSHFVAELDARINIT